MDEEKKHCSKTISLTVRENIVLEKRYKNWTFSKIGNILGVSSERARQIYNKADRKAKNICDQSVKEHGISLLTGNMTIETLIKMDAGCGDKLTHGVTGIVAGYPDPVFTQLLAKADPAMCRPVSKPGDADYVPMCETTRNFRGNYAS